MKFHLSILLRAALFCALLVTPVAKVGAEEDQAAPPEEVAADRVCEVVEAGNAAALKQVAEQDDPDPWRVVDALLARGKHTEAERFAAAAPRPAVEGLPAYVARRRGKSAATERKAIAAMNAAFAAGEPERALAAGATIPGASDASALSTVPRLRLAYGRGLALRMQRTYRESVTVFAKAALAATRLGWHRFAAQAHQEAGTSAWTGGSKAGALGAWKECLGPLRRLGDDLKVARVLNDYVAMAQVALGNDEGALASYAEAVPILRAGGDHHGLARALLKQGDAEQRRGNLSQAFDHYEEAMGLERLHPTRATGPLVFYGMANVLRKLGSYEQAMTRYEEARARFAATKNKRGVALVHSGLGNTMQRLGRYPEALRLHNRALTVFHQVRYLPGIAASLNNVANVQLQLGKHKEAIAGYEAALAICEEQGNQRFAALALKNLGSVERDEGHAKEARRRYEEAEVLFREAKDRAALASTLNDLGSLALRFEKDTTKAREHYAEALALFDELNDKPGMAMVLNNIGNSHEREGAFERAAEQYDKALQYLAESPNPTTHVAVLWSLAWLRFRQDQPEAAANFAREGITLVSRLSAGLAEGEGASARDVFRDLFDVGVRASLAADDTVMQTWMFEQGRADTLRKGLASRSALEAAIVPEELRLELAKARAAERTAVGAHQKAVKSGRFKLIRPAREAKTAAETQVRNAVQRIQREAKAAAQVVLPEADGPDRIESYVQAGEALVSYGLTDGEAVALVVTAGTTRMVPLGPSATLRARAAALTAGDKDVPIPKVRAAVVALRDVLVTPLKLGEDVKRVLVSPIEILGYVPFAMLFEKREVAYVPSGTTYGMLRKSQRGRGVGVLALGDPDYSTHAKHFNALEETRAEIENIGTEKLLGPEANERVVAERLKLEPHWRAVHFACHGIVDPAQPWRSSLVLTVEGGNDGYLTCLEIFGMKIPTDLVVLSACETGRGKIYKTEGIVGLTRAFMFAGAPRVICSLWKVDDTATRELMQEFYRLWNPAPSTGGPKSANTVARRGLPAAEALRLAQLHVKSQAKWKHPYYWAAWVLWGLPE